MADFPFSFKQEALDATSLSDLMNGREKVTTEDIIKKYPDGITITGADIVEYEKDGKPISYPVLTFKENDKFFYTGGIVLKKIVERWLSHFDSVTEMNLALAGDPVKVKLSTGRSKSGNSITNVEIV